MCILYQLVITCECRSLVCTTGLCIILSPHVDIIVWPFRDRLYCETGFPVCMIKMHAGCIQVPYHYLHSPSTWSGDQSRHSPAPSSTLTTSGGCSHYYWHIYNHHTCSCSPGQPSPPLLPPSFRFKFTFNIQSQDQSCRPPPYQTLLNRNFIGNCLTLSFPYLIFLITHPGPYSIFL